MALCVISKEKQGETYPHHDIQSNSVWSENPYPDSYVIVPEDLVDLIRATRGFCDIVLNEDGTEVYDFSKLEIPEIPEPEEKPSQEERIAVLEEQLIASDEAVTLLYEMQFAQEEINTAQDEAIIGLYEILL